MAAHIVPSLRSALERLKHAGAINGICLAWHRQTLVNLLPYEEFRADKLVNAVREAREHFAVGGRSVDTFWFGFEGVHVLATFRGDCLLIILHSSAAEVEFLTRVSSTFLNDTQLLVDATLNAGTAEVDGSATLHLSSHENQSASEPLVI